MLTWSTIWQECEYVLGRHSTMYASAVIAFICIIACSFAPFLWVYAIFRMGVGIGVGGIGTASFVLVSESIGESMRGKHAFFCQFQFVGECWMKQEPRHPPNGCQLLSIFVCSIVWHTNVLCTLSPLLMLFHISEYHPLLRLADSYSHVSNYHEDVTVKMSNIYIKFHWGTVIFAVGSSLPVMPLTHFRHY